MFARRLLFHRAVGSLRCGYVVKKYSRQASMSQAISNLEVRFSDHAKKKEKRDPIVKNFFLGIFDPQCLTFPEPRANDRYLEFINWLKPIEDYVKKCANSTEKLNKDDVVSHIRELGVFRASIDVPYKGLGCSETELAKITETLSAIPWLGTLFIKNNITPVRIISKYGSPEQKQKFLPLIANGEIIPTICVTECQSKSSINSIEADLLKSSNDLTWKLNGVKNFVVNGIDANLYIVFANVLSSNLQKNMAIALVEGNQSKGIRCTNIESTIGQREMPICTIAFEDVDVPNENIIYRHDEEYDPLVDILCPGKQGTAPQAIGILRSFIDLLTNHVLDRKHFDKNMCEIDGVQQTLSRMTAALYTMESMVYLTAGLADQFEGQDLLAENTITEVYCANECVNNIYAGLKLVGTRSYLRTQPFMKFFEDALSLTTFDMYNMDAEIYITLLGMQHAGKTLQENVRKVRNLGSNPAFHILRSLKKDPLSELDIAGQIHHTMRFGADALEEGMRIIANVTRLLFEIHGLGVIQKHEDLCKVARITTLLYACVAMLSRASRAYCIGLKNSEYERNLAVLQTIKIKENVAAITTDLQQAPDCTPDETFRAIAKQLYSHKGYFISHALERIQ